MHLACYLRLVKYQQSPSAIHISQNLTAIFNQQIIYHKDFITLFIFGYLTSNADQKLHSLVVSTETIQLLLKNTKLLLVTFTQILWEKNYNRYIKTGIYLSHIWQVYISRKTKLSILVSPVIGFCNFISYPTIVANTVITWTLINVVLHLFVANILRFSEEYLLIYLEKVIPQMLTFSLYRLALRHSLMPFHVDY